MRSITQLRVGIASLAGAFAVALLAPAMGHAAPGDITFSGCIADAGGNGCADPFQDSLDGARGVAVSPDGTSVYVTSGVDASISHFTRAANGSLSFAGCIADNGASGCADPFQDPLEGALGVAVSPDGSSVYVASVDDNSISHFSRAANGDITFSGCIADAGESGCADPFQDPLGGARGVAVSPDGSSVYVTSGGDNSISHFTRAANGSVAFSGCIADDGGSGCADPFQDPLTGAYAVAVSPDGSSVYVASDDDNSISHFTRAANGSIAFAGCIADPSPGAVGCVDPPQDSLGGARAVAVSPDGSSVYVASDDDNSISHLTRAANGSISFAGCIADNGASGCADPFQDPLLGARGVAVSPDGSSVYVTSGVDRSISHFIRAADGSIGFAGCVANPNPGAVGCVDPPQDSLDGARAVAVSPDGSSVYVVSASGNSISHFTRELPPPPADPPAPTPTPTPAADTDPPGVTLSARKVEAGKPLSVTVACDEACSVELDGTAKPKGGKAGGLAEATTQLAAGGSQALTLKPSRKLKRKLRNAGKGRAAVEAVATDAAGNRGSDSVNVKLK